MTSSSDNTASGTASEFKVETEPEKFDSLHPYPDIYYDDEEDVTDEEEDWCGECDSPLDECVCNYCSHGQPDGADCDQMPRGGSSDSMTLENPKVHHFRAIYGGRCEGCGMRLDYYQDAISMLKAATDGPETRARIAEFDRCFGP